MQVTNDHSNLFVEKYKPSSIEDVIGNEETSVKFKEFIDKKEINNLLFTGCQGSGKTLSAKIIANAISEDVLYINASNENGIETIRTKIVNFCSVMTLNDGYKIIILDESDGISPQAQGALRAIMEEYIDRTRFILTCNFLHKVIKPLHSRCEVFNFKGGNKVGMMKRCMQILKAENIGFDKGGIAELIKGLYPDFRSVLNTMQKLVQEKDGKKTLGTYSGTDDDMLGVIQLLKEKKLTKLREYIKEKGIAYPTLYRLIFNHAKEISPKHFREVYVNTAEYEYRSNFAIDQEINAMGFLSEIVTFVTTN